MKEDDPVSVLVSFSSARKYNVDSKPILSEVLACLVGSMYRFEFKYLLLVAPLVRKKLAEQEKK